MPPKSSVHRKWPRTYLFQLLGVKASLDTMQKELTDTTLATEDAYPSIPQNYEQGDSHPRTNSSNTNNEWESIHQHESFIEVDSGQAPLHFSSNAFRPSPSKSLKSQDSYGLNRTTQTDFPVVENESKTMLDTLYQDSLQKNTKLRQLEQENEQLLEQLALIKKEPPIHIEKECATCSQHASKGGPPSSESESILTNLLEQARFEAQLEKKEKVYWKKECEKVRGLVEVLEEELSLEKSNAVRVQQQCIQQKQEIDKLKYYIETECQQSSQHDESEKEQLRLQLEKSQSQIRVLQSTVQQLSSLSSTLESEPFTYSPKKVNADTARYTSSFEKPTPSVAKEPSEKTSWESYLETAQRLEKELKELHHRRDMLQSEYVKIPLTGVQHRRRKEELDSQLDTVDKEIGYIRMKLKTMNFL